MPINYHIDSQSELVYVLMEGEISMLELMNFITSIHTEQRDGSYDRLIVLRNSKCQLSGNDVAGVADFARRLHGTIARHRTAVVTSSPCEFGISRQYQLYRDSTLDNFNIFKDIEAATSWLGIDNLPSESSIVSGVFHKTKPSYDSVMAAG